MHKTAPAGGGGGGGGGGKSAGGAGERDLAIRADIKGIPERGGGEEAPGG